MTNAATALSVLADPTRRRIFELVAERPRPVGELAALLPVSRPAVSQHLQVLKSVGLVRDHAAGARRVYQIDPAGLGAIRVWLDQFWDQAIDDFATAVETEREDQE
jgi:DNA-binding transcriptional ArsR family regulator